MYETMMVWETDPSFAAGAPHIRDFAELWQAADKIVYSRTLQNVATARTRIEQEFDAAAIRRMKAMTAPDIFIGGPELAAHAFRAGLVDAVHLFVAPISVGGGKPALPLNLRVAFELLAERRFDSGWVHLGYRTKP
jgi:dihydrofolate reductase